MTSFKLNLALTLALAAGAALASGQAADQIKGLNPAFMDKTADPCTDFYQYSCGNFSKLHPIPAARGSYGNFYIMADENEKALHAILDKAAASNPNRTPNEQKIGDY